jgi:RimJ/RimL family protein N-acetyltransferase
MSRIYKCLSKDRFIKGFHELIPIRDQDKYAIMQWRNDQINVLRQDSLLSVDDQEKYFANVVDTLFDKEFPDQLLFSFLENGELIGYGGLVHINWEKKTAEISFLTKTERTGSAKQFVDDWTSYLELLKEIVHTQLHFHKIFTYAYDLRPHLYEALFKAGFIEEARLKNEISIGEGKYDVLIHACYFDELKYRMARIEDAALYFKWANNDLVRKNSYNQSAILIEDHLSWFDRKLKSGNCFFYLFFLGGNPVGQVRIEKSNTETIIGISLDESFRGKGLGKKMLEMSTTDFFSKFPDRKIHAYIKETNVPSLNIFKQAGFSNQENIIMHHEASYKLSLSKP